MQLVVRVYLALILIEIVSQGRDKYNEDLLLYWKWFGYHVEGRCGLVQNLSRAVNNFSLENFTCNTKAYFQTSIACKEDLPS